MAKLTEASQWAKFFGILTRLAPSPAVREAGRLVFGEDSPLATRKEPAIDPSLLALTRMVMLQRFESTHSGVSAAKVYGSLNVHKSDWYRWKRGELPESSIITARIEGHLKKL